MPTVDTNVPEIQHFHGSPHSPHSNEGEGSSSPSEKKKNKISLLTKSSRKLSTQVGIAKSLFLQKTGKPLVFQERKEFLDLIKTFKSNSIQLVEAAQRAESLYNAEWNAVQVESSFNSALAKLCTKSTLDLKVDMSKSTVQAFVPYMLMLQTHRRKFLGQFRALIIDPLRALCDTEVKAAQAMLEDSEVHNLDLDAKMRNFADLDGKPDTNSDKIEANRLLEECKDMVDEAKKEMLTLFTIVETKKNSLLSVELGEYNHLIRSFFAESAACVDEQMGSHLQALYQDKSTRSREKPTSTQENKVEEI